jgi:serine/threonine protein kinase/tetratricopeptide (TPR) repeat protein
MSQASPNVNKPSQREELGAVLPTNEPSEPIISIDAIRFIGKYRVIGRVGVGAFGTVFRCEDPTLQRIVCVKVLRAGTTATPDVVERFQREARTAARLSHPHIVSVYDAGYDDGRLYLVMELVEGHSLDRLIGTPQLTVETTLRVVFHLAQALEAAHEQGIIHRDVKPANILIDAAGRPKLTDFGLARLDDDSPALSRSGDLIGTPRYMSPEQALLPPAEVDHRTDLYSLGAVMYEMLTGKPVADGPTALAVLRKVTDDPPVPVTTLAPHVPAEVEAICHKLLAKDRDQRFATAGEVAKAIQDYVLGRMFGTPEVELLAGLPSLAPRGEQRSLKWPWFAIGVLVITLVAVVVGIWFVSNRPVNKPALEIASSSSPTVDPVRVVAEADGELAKLTRLTEDRAYRTALSDLLDGLNAAVKQHPSNAELRGVRGRVLRRTGEYLAAIADLEATSEPSLMLERALARYQWEVVYLNSINDSSLRPVPSKTLSSELQALAGRTEPTARLLNHLGLAVIASDWTTLEKGLTPANQANQPTSADGAMIEADALARLAEYSQQQMDQAEAEQKADWRIKRDDFDTRAAQAIRRGLAVDPHHVGLLFLKSAAWHRRVQRETADGDDRAQVERRHRPVFESAYQRYRVGSVRLSLEAATGRAILLASAERYDQALDLLNEAAGRGPLPPAVAAVRAWLQLSTPPDWELTPIHAAAVDQELASVLEQHSDEFTVYLVASVAKLAMGRWEDARRLLLDGQKVYRGETWPPLGTCWSLCRDAVKSPTQFLDTGVDVLMDFAVSNELKVKLGEEVLRRLLGPDETLRRGISDNERRELIGWGHFRQAKFHAEKERRAEVLHHVRLALETRLSDLTPSRFRTDHNLKAWNDDPEFQKLYAEFEKK